MDTSCIKTSHELKGGDHACWKVRREGNSDLPLPRYIPHQCLSAPRARVVLSEQICSNRVCLSTTMHICTLPMNANVGTRGDGKVDRTRKSLPVPASAVAAAGPPREHMMPNRATVQLRTLSLLHSIQRLSSNAFEIIIPGNRRQHLPYLI